MREVTVENDNPKTNYVLPHHGVYRPEKSTTLRPNEARTLGVSWDPVRDTFSFKVDVIPSDSYTKRSVLSTIARLFDPLGLVGPVVSKTKMFMQKLWRLSIDWKDPLPNEVYSEWHQLLIRLESLNSINIE
ncbi:uncharacterized protein TNCV_2503051 [Trichonephila clavipes]|nr:uncharacterized protein TNCV_2503051 [Trichonephila clavipes]